MKKISLPKIGIRPVIDGRRMGVRESLEEQTMNMAKATAALLTEKLPSSVSFPIPVSRVWLKPLLAKKNSAVRM